MQPTLDEVYISIVAFSRTVSTKAILRPDIVQDKDYKKTTVFCMTFGLQSGSYLDHFSLEPNYKSNLLLERVAQTRPAPQLMVTIFHSVWISLFNFFDTRLSDCVRITVTSFLTLSKKPPVQPHKIIAYCSKIKYTNAIHHSLGGASR
jgi:hypothetical protein